MAFFVKQEPITKGKHSGDIRLRIVNSTYDSSKGYGVHKNYKVLGLLSELKKQYKDPIEHFAKEAKELTLQEKNAHAIEIDAEVFKFNVGCFLPNAMLNKLNLKKLINLAFLSYRGEISPYDAMADLILSRIVCPTSKRKAYLEIIPSLYKKYCENASLNQIYSLLQLLGSQYIDVIDAFNICYARKYKRNVDTLLFDGTNFYFEIDCETDFLKNGKSKENKPQPLLGMGLMLDSEGVPLMMELYSGNEAEPEHAMSIVRHLHDANILTKKMIIVADKAHMTGESIIKYTNTGHGFIISKSPKQLDAETEKWMLEEETQVFNADKLAYVEKYEDVRDKQGNLLYRYKVTKTTRTFEFEDDNGNKVKKEVPVQILATYNESLHKKKVAEITKQVAKAKTMSKAQAKKNILGDSGKYVNLVKKDGETAKVEINQDKIDEDTLLAGYNLIITSEINLEPQDLYDKYHELQEIEHSFRLLKSQLEARPVYVSTEDAIKGHFLINYLSLFIMKIIQKKEFKNAFSMEEIIDFVRKFEMVKDGHNDYICTAKKSEMTEYIKALTNIPSLRYPSKKVVDSYFENFKF